MEQISRYKLYPNLCFLSFGKGNTAKRVWRIGEAIGSIESLYFRFVPSHQKIRKHFSLKSNEILFLGSQGHRWIRPSSVAAAAAAAALRTRDVAAASRTSNVVVVVAAAATRYRSQNSGFPWGHFVSLRYTDGIGGVVAPNAFVGGRCAPNNGGKGSVCFRRRRLTKTGCHCCCCCLGMEPRKEEPRREAFSKSPDRESVPKLARGSLSVDGRIRWVPTWVLVVGALLVEQRSDVV